MKTDTPWRWDKVCAGSNSKNREYRTEPDSKEIELHRKLAALQDRRELEKAIREVWDD